LGRRRRSRRRDPGARVPATRQRSSRSGEPGFDLQLNDGWTEPCRTLASHAHIRCRLSLHTR
jgi:hypothetical protein